MLLRDSAEKAREDFDWVKSVVASFAAVVAQDSAVTALGSAVTNVTETGSKSATDYEVAIGFKDD